MVGRSRLTTTWDRLPAPLGWRRHDCLVDNGMLGGDVVQRLECVPEEDAMLSLVWALHAVLELHTRTPLASLVMGLWLNVLALLPLQGLG
jgi:hypothetical protein